MLSSLQRPVLQHIEKLDRNFLKETKSKPDNPLFGLVWINPARVSGTPAFMAARPA